MGQKGGGNGNGGSAPRERRQSRRLPVDYSVDYHHGDTFLFSYITNISEMGIFVRSEEPLAKGTMLRLKFAPPGGEAFDLEGEVAWINPPRPDAVNPGMGIRFVHLTPETRERLVDLVRTIAYLHADDDPEAS